VAAPKANNALVEGSGITGCGPELSTGRRQVEWANTGTGRSFDSDR
jgi:hypothetical protein